MNPQIITASEYKRMAREAAKGHFWPLTLISGLALLSNMNFTSLSARAAWLIALTFILKLVHPMLDYGQKLSFTRRFRGQAYGVRMLLQYRMLRKLLGIWALRDALPLALIYAGNMRRSIDAMSLSGQALQAAGLLMNVILAFNYCMAEYMLIDAPRLSPIEALRQSRRRLSGHRFELFMLTLSFMGWILLASLALSIMFYAMSNASIVVLIVMEYLMLLPLMTYINMTGIAFFEVICRRRIVQPPVPGSARPVMSPAEAAARDMLTRHDCSRRRLEREGLWEKYLALGIPKDTEARWRHEWQRSILRHYSQRPDGIDRLLASSAEYGEARIVVEALRVMSDALEDGAVIEGTIARQTLGLLRTLNGGRYDRESEHYRHAVDGVAALTDRLERRLAQIDPDGPWQATITSIRERL